MSFSHSSHLCMLTCTGYCFCFLLMFLFFPFYINIYLMHTHFDIENICQWVGFDCVLNKSGAEHRKELNHLTMTWHIQKAVWRQCRNEDNRYIIKFWLAKSKSCMWTIIESVIVYFLHYLIAFYLTPCRYCSSSSVLKGFLFSLSLFVSSFLFLSQKIRLIFVTYQLLQRIHLCQDCLCIFWSLILMFIDKARWTQICSFF